MNTRKYEAYQLRTSNAKDVVDVLMIEHPLSISINGEPFTLTMQTPGDEFDLARGILFTEGVFKSRVIQPGVEVVLTSDDGFISTINVKVDAGHLDKSQLNKRNLLSVASCGICGKTELTLPAGESLTSPRSLNFDIIHSMFNKMTSEQNAFMVSGGCHAAAIFNVEQQMLGIKEDIGRHNAVDKVIGKLLHDQRLNEATYLLVSGRVSYEIITKCFIAGIPFLLAVSAPSSLAVDFAKELGITLIAFCRDDRATVYSHAERIL